MRSPLLALTALTTALAAVPVQAAPATPLVLGPSSPWNVDYAPDSCRLVRLFGEGEDQHYLAFQQYSPSKVFGLTVAGPGFKKFRSLEKTMINFHEAQAEEEPVQPEGEPPKAPGPGVPALDLAQGKQVQFVTLRQGKHEVRLDTGRLDQAFAVLNQCTLDLVRDWGLDPERHVTAQTRPFWNNQDVIVKRIQREYPAEAARIGEQGIMRMRVIVSAEGTVESCRILKSTQTEELDSPACKMMKNATFDPARDAAGVPFRSYFVTSLTYKLG